MTGDVSLDVIILAHDPARLDELSRSVFSVALQDHRPVTIHVVCRRFDPGELEAVRRVLAPLMTIAGDAALNIIEQGPHAGTARYAAFLEAGNLVYPEAYRLLIAELAVTGGALAIGGVLDAYVCRDGIVPLTTAKRRAAASSFVLDRYRIAPEDLTIEQPGAEDMLRRISARYPSSFRLEDKIVGENVLEATA